MTLINLRVIDICMLDFTDTFMLKNCDVTSPNAGTVRVSCDISHPILVTLTCTNNCNNPMITTNGSSPLIVTGLDPGVTYSVTVTVFNDNEVGLSDQTLTQTVTVNSGSISVVCTCN